MAGDVVVLPLALSSPLSNAVWRKTRKEADDLWFQMICLVGEKVREVALPIAVRNQRRIGDISH